MEYEGIGVFKEKFLRKMQFSKDEEGAMMLLNYGEDMNLDQLKQISPGSLEEAVLYHNALIIMKLLLAAPLGYNDCEWFCINLMSALRVCTIEDQKLLLQMYSTAFKAEILHCKCIDQLVPWLGVINELKKFKVLDISVLKDAMYIKFTTFFYDILKDLASCYDKKVAVKLLTILYQVKFSEIDIETTASHAGLFLYNYLCTKYNIYDIDSTNQPDSHEAIELLTLLGYLELKSKVLLDKLADLRRFFSMNDRDTLDPDTIKEVQAKLPDLALGNPIFSNIISKHFQIQVFKHSLPNGTLALKVYTAKHSTEDFQSIGSEIKILNILSMLASPNNCFIRYYGNFRSGDRLFLMMEYHETTLSQKITEMCESSQEFPEEYLIINIRKLLESFTEMEQLGIYHRDIKPQNILMTSLWELKIIDFSISDLKQHGHYDDQEVNKVKGTPGCMAPELEALYLQPDRKGLFSKSKADVFSLGFMILQMSSLDNLYSLNLTENNPRLLEKVEQLKYEWLKIVLMKMLQLDPALRPSFSECLGLIPVLSFTIAN